MCGIFGTVSDNCVQKAIGALHFLEYRGYDSAGISVKSGGRLQVFKTAGRVSVLEGMLPHIGGISAIGHTRWATHGEVSSNNAHPFLSEDRAFAVCHNGIVENFEVLKRELLDEGVKFSSQTDSEVVAHLLQKSFDGNVLDAVLKTSNRLSGAFALVIQTTHGNNLYAVRNKSPLVVGVDLDGHAYLSSDIRCISRWAQNVAVVPDGTVVEVGTEVKFFRFDGAPCAVEFFHADVVAGECGDGDKMLDEIRQIPARLADCQKGYFDSCGLGLSHAEVAQINKIYFLGCGTAYNSGLEAAAVARNFLRLDLLPVIASEFVYDSYPVDGHTLAFCISQSGETVDTVRAAEKVALQGGIAYAVTNTDVSSLCFVCGHVKNVFAGGEYAVASTKAYNCQLLTLLLLLWDIARLRGELSREEHLRLLDEAASLPQAVQSVLEDETKLQKLAQKIMHSSAAFFVGRTLDYPTATEGSLKLKEISYIHSEAYPSGELKHGTLALMERGVTVFVVSTDAALEAKNSTTANEITSRGADVVVVSPEPMSGHTQILLPSVHKWLFGVVSVVPLQLLAYYTAKGLGRDVDKPRNLAKSVTVE